MNRFLNLIRSLIDLAFPTDSPVPPTIDSYGQESSGLSEEQIQPIMEWLFLSLMNAGYSGNAHLIWYDDANPDPDLEQALKDAIRFSEPTFLYCCGNRTLLAPDGYYWHMMPEHPSTRIYQLEG